MPMAMSDDVDAWTKNKGTYGPEYVESRIACTTGHDVTIEDRGRSVREAGQSSGTLVKSLILF